MTSSNSYIPYGRQLVDDDDIASVVAVLKSDFLTTGPEVPLFENALASALGVGHAVACSSGTAALHLVSVALGLTSADCVIVPSITFLATASAPHLTGADVVFADVNSKTGLLTPETLTEALSRAQRSVKAVFCVHLGGQICDLPELRRICDAAGALLIEDACHALGTSWTFDGTEHSVGNCVYSHAAAFSLHPVKAIAAGEGGVVTTNCDTLAATSREFRSHGMIRSFEEGKSELAWSSDGLQNPWVYEMHRPGLNYRLTDFQAALAKSQLSKLRRFVEIRRGIAEKYDAALKAYAPLLSPVPRISNCRSSFHLYQVLIDFAAIGVSRASMMRTMSDLGVGSQVHYIPLHRQPYWRKRQPHVELPGADAFYEATLSLPMYADLAPEDMYRVLKAIETALTTASNDGGSKSQ